MRLDEASSFSQARIVLMLTSTAIARSEDSAATKLEYLGSIYRQLAPVQLK
jgi:hypothetical protein